MSVKAKTRKRLVVLVAATVGLAGLAGAGWAYHLHRKAAWYAQERSLGMEAAARGDAPETVRHLAAWLGQNPDDVEALTAYVKERPLVQASDHSEVWDTIARLRRLVELRQDDDGPRRQLMGMYARYGFSTEAKDTAEAILSRHPGDAEATKVKYESLVRLRQWDEARKLAEAWAKADPGNPEPVLRVLAVLAQTDRPAQEVMDRAKAFGAKDPGAPAAQVVLGVAYRMTGDLASAQKQLKLAAAQEPPTPALARILMDQLNRAGLYGESLDLLQRMAKKSPEDVETRRALVRRMWEMGRASDVVALTAQQGASKLGEEEMGLRAIALSQVGKRDEAKQELARLQGDKGDALAAAWAAVVSLATDPGSVEPRKLLDLCQRAAMQDSEGAYLRYYIGHAYAQLDEPDLAIEAWQGVAQQNATWALPLVRLSDAELSKGRYAQSMQAAQVAMRRSHGSALAAVNMAKVWAANVEAGKDAGHEEELLKFVADIRKQLPGDEQMLTVQVSLLAKMGKKDEATAEIKKALAAKDAPSEQTLMRLAGASRAYDLGVTDACYDRSEQAHGVTANLAFARAVDQFGHGQGPAGLAGLKAARERSGKAGDLDWELAWARYLEVTRDPAAKEAWEKLADARPEDRQVQQLALGVKSTRADREFIDRTIERLRKLTGDAGVTWKLARARWILEGAKSDQDLAQAVVLLKDVARTANDLVEPRVLLAQAYERLKDPNGAIEQLRSAAAADPSNTQVALYLSQLLQKRGEYDKARQELDRVAKNDAVDPAQKRQAAAMLAQQGDAEGAIKLLQESGGEEAGKDGKSDLLLAMLYRQRNELGKADALAEKMLASNPEPVVVQFAADLYAQQGRRADADKALARLDKMDLKPGAKELILADHATRYLGPDEAIKHFKASLAAEPKNATAWRALAGYYAYLGRGTEMAETAEAGLKEIPADATLKEVVARKDLLSAAAGDAEARPLVSAYLADPRADAPALAVMQALDAARQGGEPADQTAAKLKKLVDANPTFEPAQLILVGRYARMGRTDEAAQLASRAVQMFPSDPEPARLAVEAMSAGQRWAEAMGFAKTWRERALSNPMPADMAIAACQLQLGQAAQAAETVAPYVPAAVANPDRGDEAAVIYQYAAALNSAGQGEKAAGVLWPLAEKNAAWRKVWMQLALRLPAAQATGWLDRAATAIPADAQDERTALAEAWHTLGSRDHDAQATAKADAIFAELLARPDVKSGTALSRGIAAEQEKDMATAEAAYRRALALDPNSVVAQNNLAMVLLKKDGGDVAEATRLAKAAVEKNPRAATLHDTLAQALARGKDVDGAAASLRKALELQPDSLEWRVHLARVYLDGGRRKEADKVMQEIATLPVGRTPPSEQTQKQLDQLRAEMSRQSAVPAGTE